MDEQNNPTTEPATTTSDPVVNASTAEPQQAEPIQAPVEQAFVAETPQTATPPEPIIESGTAQIAGSEPLPASTPESTPSAGVPAESQQPETPTPTPPRNLTRLFLEKAKAVIQLHKQKKLVKMKNLFEKKTHITNDQVEKLLHVSDATATRYLSQLEKQGKIKQSGKTGKGVTYTKL